jgi:hypothetical protein
MNLAELIRLYDFTNRTVVITGGTGIIGGEMACAKMSNNNPRMSSTPGMMGCRLKHDFACWDSFI